jgi:hypothetical protein
MTKLKKQGMPVDSVESAAAWRRQRLNVAQRNPEPEGIAPAPSPRHIGPLPDDPEGFVDSGETRDEARRRREIYEADMALVKLNHARKALVEVAPMRAEFARQWAAVSQAMLNLAARMAPVLAAESDVGRCQVILDAEIRAALNQNAEVSL